MHGEEAILASSILYFLSMTLSLRGYVFLITTLSLRGERSIFRKAHILGCATSLLRWPVPSPEICKTEKWMVYVAVYSFL